MKTFSNTRGELNLQPERSGRYVYTFTHLSDANYNKIELNGPSIDQVVHPLAAAEFVGTTGQGRGRRNVNSCSGDTVDIDVDLRVTVISLRNSKSLTVIRARDRGILNYKSLVRKDPRSSMFPQSIPRERQLKYRFPLQST